MASLQQSQQTGDTKTNHETDHAVANREAVNNGTLRVTQDQAAAAVLLAARDS